MKYNKQILASRPVEYGGHYVEVLVLDNKDYYNIHILNDAFKDEEMNTLHLEESKECITLEEITNPIKLECYGLEHLLWHKHYGHNGNMYSFNVEIAEICEL